MDMPNVIELGGEWSVHFREHGTCPVHVVYKNEYVVESKSATLFREEPWVNIWGKDVVPPMHVRIRFERMFDDEDYVIQGWLWEKSPCNLHLSD